MQVTFICDIFAQIISRQQSILPVSPAIDCDASNVGPEAHYIDSKPREASSLRHEVPMRLSSDLMTEISRRRSLGDIIKRSKSMVGDFYRFNVFNVTPVRLTS